MILFLYQCLQNLKHFFSRLIFSRYNRNFSECTQEPLELKTNQEYPKPTETLLAIEIRLQKIISQIIDKIHFTGIVYKR